MADAEKRALPLSVDKLQRQFACRCGCPGCRGWIIGYDESPNDNGRQFLQHWHRPGRG